MAGWWISRQIPTTVNCSFFSRPISLHTASTLSALLYYTSSCSSAPHWSGYSSGLYLQQRLGKINSSVVRTGPAPSATKDLVNLDVLGSLQNPQHPIPPSRLSPTFTKTFWKTPHKTFGKYWILLQNPGWGFWFISKMKLPSQQPPGRKQDGMKMGFLSSGISQVQLPAFCRTAPPKNIQTAQEIAQLSVHRSIKVFWPN